MIKKYQSGSFAAERSLLEALGVVQQENPVISVVGAGGKTTLIAEMANEYRKRKIPVIVTTTTHMMAERYPWFLLEPALDKAMETIRQNGMVWLGLPDKNGKMKAPPAKFLREMIALNYPVLIEADGAKKLPLKVPAEHEPVLLPETTCVVNVYGLDAIGKKWGEICFRADTAVNILNKKLTDKVEEEDIAELAFHSLSGRKGVLSSMEYRVILNKADTPERESYALKICRLARLHGFMELIVTANSTRKAE